MSFHALACRLLLNLSSFVVSSVMAHTHLNLGLRKNSYLIPVQAIWLQEVDPREWSSKEREYFTLRYGRPLAL